MTEVSWEESTVRTTQMAGQLRIGSAYVLSPVAGLVPLNWAYQACAYPPRIEVTNPEPSADRSYTSWK